MLIPPPEQLLGDTSIRPIVTFLQLRNHVESKREEWANGSARRANLECDMTITVLRTVLSIWAALLCLTLLRLTRFDRKFFSRLRW